MTRCQNPGCRRDAVDLYRDPNVGERDLCAECVESLNAMGFDWQRVPTWIARGRRGENRGRDLTGRLVA